MSQHETRRKLVHACLQCHCLRLVKARKLVFDWGIHHVGLGWPVGPSKTLPNNRCFVSPWALFSAFLSPSSFSPSVHGHRLLSMVGFFESRLRCVRACQDVFGGLKRWTFVDRFRVGKPYLFISPWIHFHGSARCSSCSATTCKMVVR